MKTTTKTGRKIVGALVSAAVMISMIPAMVLAVPDPQTVTVDIVIPEDVTVDGDNPYTENGIIIATEERGLITSEGIYLGNYNPQIHYGIAIDNSYDSMFNGGTIRSITIETGTFAGSQPAYAEGFDNGDGGRYTLNRGTVEGQECTIDDTLVWTGDSDEVDFVLGYNGGTAKTLPIRSFTVEVEVPADGIQIITPTVPIPLIPDMSLTAYAQFLPSNTTYSEGIVWSGDNDSVATVSADGIITPVGIGTFTLTASYAGLEDSVTLEVYDFTEGVIINPSQLNLTVDDQPYALACCIGSETETHDISVFWISYDEDVATVDSNGVVTPVGVGTTTVEVWIVDYTVSKFYSAACTVNVSFYSQAQLTEMSVRNFVGTLYTRILHREFDAAGRDSWMSLLMEKGGTATDVILGFFGSAEYRSYNTSNEEFVNTLYWVMCNRAGSSAEIADWVSKLDAGATRESVIREFAASQEWTNLCAFFKVNV